ncbi:hypothetical protein AYO21_11998 [Fonsecaea monophora]|uniref:Uncharacterized protein n=1 Tax=Fonsecaea monophora TaxID=254056 RepID=A0A177EQJ2_9EURO|nr:hypothetical protein AYO21_11998 [Fonsecaea monophora]OAG33896.1 hypothetical protein AYO21_11998 [Fonsecaea monophora]
MVLFVAEDEVVTEADVWAGAISVDETENVVPPVLDVDVDVDVEDGRFEGVGSKELSTLAICDKEEEADVMLEAPLFPDGSNAPPGHATGSGTPKATHAVEVQVTLLLMLVAVVDESETEETDGPLMVATEVDGENVDVSNGPVVGVGEKLVI